MQDLETRDVDLNWRILKDTAILSGVGSVFTFIKPLRAVVIGRILGPYAYGLFNIPLPYIQLFSIFANMGLSAAILRTISVKLAEKDEAGAKALYRTGLSAAMASSVIWSVLLSALAPLLGERFASEPQAVRLILLGAWMIPGVTLSAVLSNVFLAFGRGSALGFVRTIYSLLSLILPVGFVLAYRSPFQVLFAFVVTELAAAAIAFFHLQRNVIGSIDEDGRKQKANIGPLLRLAHSFFYTNLGWMLINSVDRIMIQRFCATEILGFYAVSVFFVNFLNIIPMNFAQVITPSITISLTRGQTGKAWDTLRITTHTISMIFMPMVVFTCVFADQIVALLFSSAFLPAAFFLRILSFIAILNFICKLSWSIIVSDSDPGAKSLSYISAALVNVALNLALIPRLGGAGAAWASVISYCLLAIVLQVILKRKTGKTLPFSRILPAFSATLISIPVYMLLKGLRLELTLFAGLVISALLYILAVCSAGILRKSDAEHLFERSHSLPGILRRIAETFSRLLIALARK